MRFSLCCVKCDQVIQLGWKLCPQCGIRVEEGENVSTDRLRESIKSDVAKFYAANNFWRGDEFITEAAKTCLFDWQWASKLGFPEGQWFVARCYDLSVLKIPNCKNQAEEAGDVLAVELLQKAACAQFPPAQCDLSKFMRENRGGLRWTPVEAFKLVQAAASRGYLYAKDQLSFYYNGGHGVQTDKARALQILLEVAEEGFPPAQAELASSYRIGSKGFATDPTLAMKWFRRAADAGYSQGMFGVGCLYYNGEGVPKDKEQASRWFHKAAELDHSESKRVIERESRKFFPWKF